MQFAVSFVNYFEWQQTFGEIIKDKFLIISHFSKQCKKPQSNRMNDPLLFEVNLAGDNSGTPLSIRESRLLEELNSSFFMQI